MPESVPELVALLMVRRLGLGNVRVSRIACAVEGAHPIPIERVIRQPSIWVGCDVCPDRADWRKVGAIVSRAALNGKTSFIVRVIRPRQVDLSG